MVIEEVWVGNERARSLVEGGLDQGIRIPRSCSIVRVEDLDLDMIVVGEDVI